MTTKIEDYTCEKWFYGPQRSKKGKQYNIMGKTFREIWKECENSSFIKNKLQKYDIADINIFITIMNMGVRAYSVFLDKIFDSAKDIEPILSLHSLFIISRTHCYDRNYNSLYASYSYFYNKLLEEKLVNKEHIAYFIEPAFYKFNTKEIELYTLPLNIIDVFRENTTKESLQRIINTIKVIYKNSTTAFLSKDVTDLCYAPVVLQSCIDKFKNTADIQDLYKPIMDIITCFCSYFKHRLTKTSSTDITLYTKSKELEISDGDFNYIKEYFCRNINTEIKPIAIYKYVLNEKNVCPNKNYLSQLFEKACPLLYKPIYVEHSLDKDINIVNTTNSLIEKTKCGAYFKFSIGNTVFDTSIAKRVQQPDGLYKDILSQYSNIPVFFILENSKLYYDYFCGPSFQFFNDVLKELIEHEVFIRSKTLFNNDRYELNMRFNIDKLESYMRLPSQTRTPETKKITTEYFYTFIGNMFHFVVANNLILPFKLSRVYIIKLFSLVDLDVFTDNIQIRMLLISIFMIEKASTLFYNRIVNIFQNPELLKDIEVIQELDPELIDDVEELKSKNKMSAAKALMENGVRMNGLKTLDKENKPIYVKDDPVKVLYNMIDYLYKTAYKAYFESAYEDKPITPEFKINENLNLFFKGFTKQFEISINKGLYFSKNLINTKLVSSKDIKDIFQIVRKMDIYLSGFGITFEVIRDVLLHKIVAKLTDEMIVRPFEELKKTTVVSMDYLKNFQNDPHFRSITDPVKSNLIRNIFRLFRILLSRGEYIPIDFINGYNEFMFKTKIPPYIVKATIKYNNRNEIKIPSGATVELIDYDIIIVTTTSDKRLIIPKGAKVTYENTPILSGYHDNMTPEDYHNEFVKYLLKFWSGSPNISDSTYGVDYYYENTNKKKITSATCFITMHIYDKYSNDGDLYKDLANAIMHTGFGEMLGGSSGKRR
jgi:hypothetical protein